MSPSGISELEITGTVEEVNMAARRLTAAGADVVTFTHTFEAGRAEGDGITGMWPDGRPIELVPGHWR